MSSSLFVLLCHLFIPAMPKSYLNLLISLIRKEVFRISNTFKYSFSYILKNGILGTVSYLPPFPVWFFWSYKTLKLISWDLMVCLLFFSYFKVSGLLFLGSFTNLGSCSEPQQSPSQGQHEEWPNPWFYTFPYSEWKLSSFKRLLKLGDERTRSVCSSFRTG